MKNVKHFVALAALTAMLATFFVGCSMNNTQEIQYYNFIDNLFYSAQRRDLTAEYVKERFEIANKTFKAIGLKITDTQAGKGIAKGTTRVDLKKRFPAKRI